MQVEFIEKALLEAVHQLGETSLLRDACEYAVMGEGKRLRPQLVWAVGEALGHGLDLMSAAVSVEFFHTASLIADDLPCMDNDDMRRNRPSLHKAFGEGTALLTSYTLIGAGYEQIHQNGSVLKKDPRFSHMADQTTILCFQAATRVSGLRGATLGQFLDLHPPSTISHSLDQILYLKTGTLFEVALLFGWLFGGGSWGQIDTVRKMAYHLGVVFQIADDFQDITQDQGKVDEVNTIAVMGIEGAKEKGKNHLALLAKTQEELGLVTPFFTDLICQLSGFATRL